MAATNSRKNYKTNYKKNTGGELICKNFGVNGIVQGSKDAGLGVGLASGLQLERQKQAESEEMLTAVLLQQHRCAVATKALDLGALETKRRGYVATPEPLN